MPALIIAQSSATSSADAMLLALKRWIGGGTLSSPDSVSSPDFMARFWLIGLGLLLLAGILIQGPRGFFSGLLEWSRARQLILAGFQRLRNRPVVTLAMAGFVLFSWTTIQLIHYADPLGIDNLQRLLRTKTLPVASIEQGFLAALTPLRDLTNLADCWPIVAAGALIAFQFTSKLQWVPRSTMQRGVKNAQFWAHAFWLFASVWLVYRMVVGISSEGGLPLNTGAYVEVLIEPLMLLLIDSVVLSWILTELRDAPFSDHEQLLPNVENVLSLLPGLFFVNFLVTPGRYAAHGLWLVWNAIVDLITANNLVSPTLVNYVVWGLSWGIIYLQVMAFPLMILIGAAAWSQGSFRETLRISARIMKAQASTVFLITFICGVLNIISTSIISTLILSHPTEAWVLMAADSYSHYASLFLGLLLVSCQIQLGEESLITAGAVEPESH